MVPLTRVVCMVWVGFNSPRLLDLPRGAPVAEPPDSVKRKLQLVHEEAGPSAVKVPRTADVLSNIAVCAVVWGLPPPTERQAWCRDPVACMGTSVV